MRVCVRKFRADYSYDNKEILPGTPMLDCFLLFRVEENWKVSELAIM